MNIKTVWAVYFSGTGTTEKVATTLAKDLAERLGPGTILTASTCPRPGRRTCPSGRRTWWCWAPRCTPGGCPTC